MPTPFELQEQANQALGFFETEKQRLHDEFTAKGSPVPADREAALDRAWDDYNGKRDAAATATKGANRERQIAADKLAQEHAQKSAGRLPVGAPGVTAVAEDGALLDQVVYKGRDNELATYSPTGRRGWTPAQEAAYTAEMRDFLMTGEMSQKGRELGEVRKGLQLGLDTSGGFWAAPEIFEKELIQALRDATFMRQQATVRSVPKGTTGLVVRTATALSAATWTTELATATADTTSPAGARRLTPHAIAKRVIASQDELDADEVAGESWIMSEMGLLFAEAEETAFMVGTGAGQPEGIFVSSLPTDQAAASQTAIVADDLKNTVGALKAQYKAGASWIFHRTILLAISKMATGNDVYIWQPSFQLGQPNVLCGFPVNETEFAPNTQTAGLYVGALGNWKRAYRIIEVPGTAFNRFFDSNTTPNVWFDGRRQVDGMVVDGNGVVRLKQAA